MIALAVALAAIVAGQVGLVAWLVYGRIADVRSMATERVAHTATNGLLERAKFELEATAKANTEQQRIIDGLEDVLAGYINATPNADLARNDVLGRVVRAAQRQAEAGRVDPVGPATVEALPRPEPPASERPGTALMRPDD